jgi:hypothetical protein
MDRDARADNLREVQIFWTIRSDDFDSPPDWSLTETYFVEASDLGEFVKLYIEFRKAPVSILHPKTKDTRSIIAILCKPFLPLLFRREDLEKYDEPFRTEAKLTGMTWKGAGLEWILWENPLWEERLCKEEEKFAQQLELAFEGRPMHRTEGWADLSYWEAL